MSSLEDCYGVLGVATYAPKPEVSQAYKLLIHVWHPDRFEHQPRIRAQAEEQLKRINAAYRQIQAAGFPEIPRTAYDDGDFHAPAPEVRRREVSACPWCGVQNRLPSGYHNEDLTCGGCRRRFRLDAFSEPVKIVEGHDPRRLLVSCPWCSMSNWRPREKTITCTGCGRSFRLGKSGEPVKGEGAD